MHSEGILKHADKTNVELKRENAQAMGIGMRCYLLASNNSRDRESSAALQKSSGF